MAKEHRHALPRGHKLGNYRIEQVLGAGGFGITYIAEQTAIGRRSAIKEYLPAGVAARSKDDVTVEPLSESDRADFEYGLERFREEARTLVNFRHPNIVTVFDFFEANGSAYLVMEYVEGKALNEILEKAGTLPEHEIREILDPLLDGLEEVHKAGFLHRDIKPGNIFIQVDGTPVLLDFGAARLALGAKSKSLTAVVTAGYAPFEQYQSRGNQGVWTDIYAMGGVLYRCVTGEKPIDATDRMPRDTLTPASERALGRYSPPFLAAIDAALRVDDSQRPKNIAEWRQVLGGRAPAPGPTPPPPPAPVPRASNPWPKRLIAAGIGVVLAVGAVVAWTQLRKDEPGTIVQAKPKTPPVQQAVTPKPQVARPKGPPAGTPIQDCSVCPQLVVIPAGAFIMGSPTNEAGRKPAEGPQHRVVLRKKLAVGRFEVTFAEWDACVAGGGCRGYRPDDRGWGRGSRPVINISWRDAQAYLQWLSKKTGKTYRLPTEAEWEYAARAGTKGARYWTGKGTALRANCKGCGSKWDYKQTAPVGRFAGNPFGLYDMLGNAWEWVADCWSDNYDGRVSGKAKANCKFRVSRGGSYLTTPTALRAAHRSGDKPGARDFATGFRVVREVE